jgi:hypothetical protein
MSVIPEHIKMQFLTAPRQKIPLVIYYHFQGDMTKLNKDFHSQFQPIGFTTYRIKAGIAIRLQHIKITSVCKSPLIEIKSPFILTCTVIPIHTGWLSKAYILPPLLRTCKANYSSSKNGVFQDVNALWVLQEPHGVTSQKTTFFIVTTVKTSNLT